MDTEKFKKDILPIQDKLYRYALSIVHEEEIAKDIVQEVFLKLWDKRSQLSDIKNKEAWCIRMTRNLAFDKLKAANRKNVGLDQANSLYTIEDSPAGITENKDLIAAVTESMEGLSDQQKEIFRLRDLLGYSNKEIAEITGLNTNQIKVNLFRARQKIKVKLGKLINYGL